MGISINQCREIIKNVLSLPESERLETLKKIQESFGGNPEEFSRQLFATCKHYDGLKKPTIREHLTPDELEAIKPTLEQLRNENVVYLCADGKYYSYPFDKTEIPRNLINDCKKWFDMRPKYQLSIEAREKWQAEYKKWLDEYDHIRPLLLAKGIEYAVLCLQHCQQHEPNDLHQIDSLLRRIKVAERILGESHEDAPHLPHSGLEFIKDELHEIFLKIEGKLAKEKAYWDNGAPDHKTECAAFCEVLFNRNYFKKEKIARLTKTNEFARARYGYFVYNMLKAGKADERKHYFSKFNKAFL